jgi:4-diphosphocytidyl-2-C-methyl-D-erythritol kinase
LAEAVVREFAPAKINLHLHVVGRRQDGYHLLDSLVVFAGTGDWLEVAPAPELTLTVTGPFAGGLATEPDNLVLRAARGLANLAGTTPTGAIRLEKNLPVASGIGGGSADAAAALRLLCRFWGISPDLTQLARSLGADVPVCLRSRPALMSGIGEILAAAPAVPDVGLVLLNPGVAVSTPAVFRARTAGFSPPAGFPAAGWPSAEALSQTLAETHNDLEAPARFLAPEIDAALAALANVPGCHIARMSGSGATCFGLFVDSQAARHAAETLQRDNWWVWGGSLKTE